MHDNKYNVRKLHWQVPLARSVFVICLIASGGAS
jgi:hypothetical protein